METVAAPDRAVMTVRHLDGESRDVLISYRWNFTDGGHMTPIKTEIVDDAIERLLLKADRGTAQSGPIKICVEHCQAEHRHHELIAGYVKVYLDGYGSGMVIAY